MTDSNIVNDSLIDSKEEKQNGNDQEVKRQTVKIKSNVEFKGGFATKYGVTFYNNQIMLASVSEKYNYQLVKVREVKKQEDDKMAWFKILLFLLEEITAPILLWKLKIGKYVYASILIGYGIYTTIKVRKYKKVCTEKATRFHAAEHMAYNALKKRLIEYSKTNVFKFSTLDDIKAAKRYAKECSTSLVGHAFSAALLCFLFSLIFGFSLPIVLVYNIIMTFKYDPIAYVLQMLVFTKKPQENDLITAKHAIEKFFNVLVTYSLDELKEMSEGKGFIFTDEDLTKEQLEEISSRRKEIEKVVFTENV